MKSCTTTELGRASENQIARLGKSCRSSACQNKVWGLHTHLICLIKTTVHTGSSIGDTRKSPDNVLGFDAMKF